MKRLCFLLFASFLFMQMQAQSEPGDTLKLEPVRDSVEYELLIFDSQFESWFIKNRKPKEFYSETYYHGKNSMFVVFWNGYFTSGKYPNVVENYIDYNPQIEYGLELEFQLYYYFKFVEEYHKIKLH